MTQGVTYEFKGEHFDEDKFLQEEGHDEKHMATRLLGRCKVTTAFWFNDYEEVNRLMEENKFHKFSMDKADPGVVENKPLYLYLGISCVSMALKCKGTLEERKHRKRAGSFLKKIRSLAQKGDPNVQHAETLLDAEVTGLYGNPYVAESQYDVAILLGERNGFMNDTALAHERLADFLTRKGEEDRAKEHYDRAFELYTQWGAKCRLNALRARVEHLKKPVHQIEVASSFQVEDDVTQVSGLQE